jgi:hypothetical protein
MNCRLRIIDEDKFYLDNVLHQISYYENLIGRKAKGSNIHKLKNYIGALKMAISHLKIGEEFCEEKETHNCIYCQNIAEAIRFIILNTK